MTNTTYNKYAILIIVCIFFLANTAQALTTIEIAELAKPATVGVYASVGEDKYYGTGVLISSDGTIITSTTVVPPESDTITVYFEDHTSLNAEIIESSETTESVLLKVKTLHPQEFPFLPLQTALPTLGEPTYTLGNASNMIKLGDGVSFSAGVISGMYRIPSSEDSANNTLLLLETDAAVNDGQDGGGLLNSSGEVIGIISKEFSPLRWQGTAIPIGEIISSLNYLASNTNDTIIVKSNKSNFQPQFSSGIRRINSSLVSIKVDRLYPNETLKFPTWSAYKAQIPNWKELNSTEQRRLIIDFFSVESLISANQMLRRPAQDVTGLVISPDGYIITSAFNVESSDSAYINPAINTYESTEYQGSIEDLLKDSSKNVEKVNNRVIGITVTLRDGQVTTASIVGFNTTLGLALLKADLSKPAKFYDLKSNITTPVLGTDIAIIGINNNSYTVNTGIVSADTRDNGNYFQVDALLNYGNSGGPIINKDGMLLGIAARPLTPSPISGVILPFSKSSDIALNNAPTLKEFTSTPNSGISMGIMGERIEETLPKLIAGEGITDSDFITLGVSSSEQDPYSSNVVVGRVKKASPAAHAGFQIGDIIKSMDGIGIRSWSEINNYIAQKKRGQVIIFTIRRPLEKPHLLINGKKISTHDELIEFINNNSDGKKINGHVSSPGINQKLYVTLK